MDVRTWTWALGLAALATGGPLVLLASQGALGIPWADDWAYTRMAITLQETGALHFVGWNDVSLVGHLAWGVPWLTLFGPSVVSAHLAGSAATFIGLLGAFAVFRRFLPPRHAVLALATVAITPLCVLLSATYMTDIPAFATEMWCLALGISWVRSRSLNWLTAGAALAVGAFGFTIRESALSAPAAVLIGALIERRSRRERIHVLALAAAFGAALVIFYQWRQGLATHQFERSPQVTPTRDFLALSQALMVVAFVAFPAAALAIVRGREGIGSRALALGGAAGLAVAVATLANQWYHGRTETLFMGNILTRVGALGDRVLPGSRAPLFPLVVWDALELAAVLSACVVLAALIRAASSARLRELPPGSVSVAAYGVLSAGAFALRSDSGGPLYDRYLLGLSVAALILVMRTALPTKVSARVRPGVIALAVPALVSAALLVDSAAYTRARWGAGERAVAQGVPADAVNAGFEWDGYHHRGVIAPTTTAPAVDELSRITGASAFSFGDVPCIVISDSPQAGVPLVKVIHYTTLAGLADRRLYEYRIPPVCRAIEAGGRGRPEARRRSQLRPHDRPRRATAAAPSS